MRRDYKTRPDSNTTRCFFYQCHCRHRFAVAYRSPHSPGVILIMATGGEQISEITQSRRWGPERPYGPAKGGGRAFPVPRRDHPSVRGCLNCALCLSRIVTFNTWFSTVLSSSTVNGEVACLNLYLPPYCAQALLETGGRDLGSRGSGQISYYKIHFTLTTLLVPFCALPTVFWLQVTDNITVHTFNIVVCENEYVKSCNLLPTLPFINTTLTKALSYVITELLQSDLHKIIVSPQHLSADHIKVFLYQILRGECTL